MKRNIFQTVLSQFIFIGIIMLLSLLTTNESIGQFIRNGSFEFHKVNTYPIDVTGAPDYHINQLMKCIGFCNEEIFPFGWTPVGSPLYCEQNQYYAAPRDGGWYWATKNASPDYFHIRGTYGAKIPLVYTYVGPPPLHPRLGEYRFPYGYGRPLNERYDSAFTGIRMYARNNEQNIFTGYKEYIQSKLATPITGPAVFEVKFYVSRSNYSPAIKKIGALFTDAAYVNPGVSEQPEWAWNLYKTNTNPKEYLTNPQICSDVLLNQKADDEGYGGWQEVSGLLKVPLGVTYNYITIGNFQSDMDLYNDVYPAIDWPYNPYEYQLYYFIDAISIVAKEFSSCRCDKSFVDVEITKQSEPEDTTKCCYDYNITIPQAIVSGAVCSISKIELSKNGTLYIERTSEEGDFNGEIVSGSFCVDKFNTSDNMFTLKLYEKVGNEYVLHPTCSRNIPLNCKCDCSNLTNYPYPDNKPTFRLVKVDSEEDGNCCWDVVLENPQTNDSSSCEFNLSEMKLLPMINNSMIFQSYSKFAGDFPLDPDHKYWEFPDNFILKPGDKVTIGRICSNGIPSRDPINYNDVEIKLVMSNTGSPTIGVCNTVLSANLSCDSIGICCDAWDLSAEVQRVLLIGQLGPKSSCLATIKFWFNHAVKYCDYDAPLQLQIYDSLTGSNIYQYNFALKGMYMPMLPVPMIPFSGTKTICMRVINQLTNDTCLKCITLNCPNYDTTAGDPSDIFDLGVSNWKFGVNDNLPYDYGNNESIRVYPNPFESYCIVEFISGKDLKGEITLQDNLGKEIVTQSVNTVEGVNSIKFENLNLTTGLYFITVKLPDRYDAKQVIFIK